jgi:fatty acid desaturase
MLMTNNAIVRNYWLVLAAMYGLTLSVVAMADWPWPLFMGAAGGQHATADSCSV